MFCSQHCVTHIPPDHNIIHNFTLFLCQSCWHHCNRMMMRSHLPILVSIRLARLLLRFSGVLEKNIIIHQLTDEYPVTSGKNYLFAFYRQIDQDYLNRIVSSYTYTYAMFLIDLSKPFFLADLNCILEGNSS